MRIYPWFLIILVSLGCQKSDLKHKPTVPVRLEVFCQGKPMAKAVVFLHPQEEDDPEVFRRIRPTGVVDDQGVAVLTSYVTHDGAPEGVYIVTVYWPAAQANGDSSNEAEKPDRLQGAYCNPATSPWRLTVTQAGAAPARFEIP